MSSPSSLPAQDSMSLVLVTFLQKSHFLDLSSFPVPADSQFLSRSPQRSARLYLFPQKNPIIFISAGTSLCPGCGSDFAHRKVYSTSCLVTTSALLFEIALGTGRFILLCCYCWILLTNQQRENPNNPLLAFQTTSSVQCRQ